MIILYFILLGLIQGLTEFLPVSSSGHLAVAQHFLDLQHKNDVSVEIVAHLGSLISIVFFYRKDFFQINHLTAGFSKQKERIIPLIISTLPAGFLGFFFQDILVGLFSNMKWVAVGFFVTSGLLISLKALEVKAKKKNLKEWPSNLEALVIGFSQAMALFPGISRSGSTIVTGMWVGLKPKQAAFFSFCSVIPLIVGASLNLLYKMIANFSAASLSLGYLSVLLFSSFFFGWMGLLIVDRFLEKDEFFYFAFYLLPLSIFLFFFV